MKVSDILDVLGILALVAFVFFVWPPLCLLVLAAAFLLISWRRSRGGR